MATYALMPTGVTRLEDGAVIPNDPGNADWVAFQQWQAAGGVPRPLAPGSQYDWNGSAWVVNAQRQALVDALAKLVADLAAVKADGPIVAFLKMSPAEIDNYVDTNFPGAAAPMPNLRVVLKVLGKVLAVSARAQIANIV